MDPPGGQVTTPIDEFGDYVALDPFFRIIEEGLAGVVDGRHFFDLLAEDVVFEYVTRSPGNTTSSRCSAMSSAPCAVHGPIPETAVSAAMNSSSESPLNTFTSSRPPDHEPRNHRVGIVKPGPCFLQRCGAAKRNIYAKLDARDRSTAVERARELRLIASSSVAH